MNYELKHIHGIPYYLDGTTVRTFELVAGKPGANCIAIGTYNATDDSITYYTDWRERVKSNQFVNVETIVLKVSSVNGIKMETL